MGMCVRLSVCVYYTGLCEGQLAGLLSFYHVHLRDGNFICQSVVMCLYPRRHLASPEFFLMIE